MMEKRMNMVIDLNKISPEKLLDLKSELKKYGKFEDGEFIYDDKNNKEINELLDKFLLCK